MTIAEVNPVIACIHDKGVKGAVSIEITENNIPAGRKIDLLPVAYKRYLRVDNVQQA
jgi:hypothetical protein